MTFPTSTSYSTAYRLAQEKRWFNKNPSSSLMRGRIALKLGKPSRLGEGCNDWLFGEFGILHERGTSVPLSVKLLPHELIFRINHSGTRFLFVSVRYVEIVREIERIFIFRGYLPE